MRTIYYMKINGLIPAPAGVVQSFTSFNANESHLGPDSW